MLERGGDITTKGVPNQRTVTLAPVVAANVLPGGDVNTDELRSYGKLADAGHRHLR